MMNVSRVECQVSGDRRGGRPTAFEAVRAWLACESGPGTGLSHRLLMAPPAIGNPDFTL